MSARRLLVLCYFYPPLGGGGVHRVLGFTRHLPRHGWNTTVVCAGEEDYWVIDASLEERIPEATEVVRVTGGSGLAAWLRLRGTQGRRSGREFAALRRLSDWWLLPDSYVGWAKRAERAATALVRRRGTHGPEGFDAVLSSSPPDSVHLAARGVKRSTALPWVADFRDPWFSLVLREPPTAWHRARQQAMETSVLAEADLLLAASATHAAELERRVGSPRLRHLPNGYEPLESAAEPAATDAERAVFRCVYTGMLTLMPDVGVVLDALHEMLREHPDARRRLRLTLVGPYDSGYEDRAVALGLTPGIVEFAGPKPHAEARALQRRADLLLLWKPRNLPTMVPGKTYEYLDSGRPILAVLDPADEAARLVARAGAVVVPPGDRRAITGALGAAYAAWRAGTPPAAVPTPWLAEHTREHLAARLAEHLDRLVGERS